MENTSTNAIETPNAFVFLKEGIIRMIFKQGAKDSVIAAHANIDAAQTFAKESQLVLVDIRGLSSTIWAARQIYGNKYRIQPAKAIALIVGSSLSRMAGHYYIHLHKPPIPVRVFDSEDSAVSWLAKF